MKFDFLSGYKTYVLGAMTVLGSVAAVLVGEASLADAINTAVTAILGMTIRHGIASK